MTLKSRLRVTQGHWKRNHWIDHTRLTISRVIWRWILSWPWKLGCGFLRTIKCCSVVCGVTLRLLVTNVSSSSPVNNKRRRLLPLLRWRAIKILSTSVFQLKTRTVTIPSQQDDVSQNAVHLVDAGRLVDSPHDRRQEIRLKTRTGRPRHTVVLPFQQAMKCLRYTRNALRLSIKDTAVTHQWRTY